MQTLLSKATYFKYVLAFILGMSGPGTQTHYPGIASTKTGEQ